MGDALIDLIDFARSEPLVFLEVAMPLLTSGLFVSFFIFRIIIVPVGQFRQEFEVARRIATRLLDRSASK